MRHYLVPKITFMLICKKVCNNCNKVSYLQKNKNAITWKVLFRRKLTFLSKLDLLVAIN